MSKLSCLVLAVSLVSFGSGCAEQKGRKKSDKKAETDKDRKADTKRVDKRADKKTGAGSAAPAK